MKNKTTKKAIMQNYDCISVNYCALQTLLKYNNANYYTCGVYGWNADIYTFGHIAIVTGYRPFGTIKVNYELCEKYEKKAIEMQEKFIDNQKDFENLIESFIQEAIKNNVID